jgi:carboxyl-terminal processing protease
MFEGETEGKFGGVGIEVDARGDFVTVIAPIEGSPAERAGIRSGDQIVSIDGKPMRGERLDKMVGLMRGVPGSKVRVGILRPGRDKPFVVELTREVIKVKSVVAKRLDGDVAYVRLKQFQDGTHEELLRAVGQLRSASPAPLRSVLLDLRNNPGGLVDEAEAVADEFLGDGTIYSTRHRGKIVDEVKAHAGGAFATLPVVALVSEYSASAAELLAGALQDNGRASIVGATTFGKGSVQTIFDLPGGAGLRLTTMRYYTPSGHSIQALGIRPDVVVKGPDDGKPAAVGVVRERDLEGHLVGEQGGASKAAQVVLKSDKPLEQSGVGRKEVPVDPDQGGDFALKVGYDMLRKATTTAR